MQQRYKYTTIDTILSKFFRDYRGVDINEGDAIEWTGEALGFMQCAALSEEAVAFAKVENYQTEMPKGLHYITQIAKSSYNTEGDCGCTSDSYTDWTSSSMYKSHFSPVRLSNHSFFNTLVCQEANFENLYKSCDLEYTVVSDQLRFNFKEGYVAIAHLKQQIDKTTGYPLIPDNESAKAAITYYLGWKINEREAWNHREGAAQLAQMAEAKWLKYIKQFKNGSKMPWGVDEHLNLRDQSKYFLPKENRYYGFFGNLGKPEQKIFNGFTKNSSRF